MYDDRNASRLCMGSHAAEPTRVYASRSLRPGPALRIGGPRFRLPIAILVSNGCPMRVGSRGVFAAACAALAALAFACPAAAQLPSVKIDAQLPELQLPLQNGAVGDAVPGDVVEETLNETVEEPLVVDTSDDDAEEEEEE